VHKYLLRIRQSTSAGRMLILSADIPEEPARYRADRCSRIEAAALIEGSAEVIPDRLAKVVAVAQGLAGDIGVTLVKRIQRDRLVVLAVAPKFFVELFNDLANARLFGKALREVFGLLELPGALAPGPRTQPGKLSLDITHGSQALQGRINPAVQRNERRAQFRGVKFLGIRHEGAVGRRIEFRIVMRLVYLMANQPSRGSAHDHVGWKMPAAGHPADADGSSATIDQYLSHRARILMGDHRGRGPAQHGMRGWKRRVADVGEKLALAARRFRPLARENDLEGLVDSEAVHQGLARKKTRLARARLSVPTSPCVHESGNGNETCHAHIGNIFAEAHSVGIRTRSLHAVLVAAYENSRGCGQRSEPYRVIPAQAHRTGPDGLLV